MKRSNQVYRGGALCICVFIAVTAGCGGGPGASEAAARGAEAQLDEIMEAEAPAERYPRLLKLRLDGSCSRKLALQAGRTALELGRLREAEIWLAAARNESAKMQAADAEGETEALLWYLSARCAWKRLRFRRCIGFARKAARMLEPQPETGGAERLAQVRLLEARSRLAGGIEPLAGGSILADLADSRPDVLDTDDILQAAEICIRSSSDSEHRPNSRSDEQLEPARTLLRLQCSSRAFLPVYAEVAAELCRRCGMDAEYKVSRMELDLFSSNVKPGESTDELHTVLRLIAEDRWRQAFAAVQAFRESDAAPQHRFIRYLYTLTRLYCEPENRGVQEEYARMARYYGRQQLYFVYLHRALANTAARQLYQQALQGCIAAGAYSAAAGEARAALAVQAGIPAKYQAQPLLAAEMEQIARIVRDGGPPELLQPLTAALEWPENQFTLQAGLILRRLRGMPAVRSFLSAELQSAGQRERERLRALLQL